MTALSPEKLAEIKDRAEHASGYTIVAHISILEALISEDIPALLTEIQRLQEQVEIVRHVGAEETRKAAYEAMDAERRSWESRRAVENVTLAGLHAEIERLHKKIADLEGEQTLTESERESFLASLDPFDTKVFAEFILNDHPAVFDAAAAKLKRTHEELADSLADISRTDDQPGGSK